MNTSLILFIVVIGGALCLNARSFSEYDEDQNIEEDTNGNNRGGLANDGDSGNGALSRQKRSSRHYYDSSASSERRERRQQKDSGSQDQKGRQFFAVNPGVVGVAPLPYGAPGYGVPGVYPGYPQPQAVVYG